MVRLIANTTTAKGLTVTCRLDRRRYSTGRKVKEWFGITPEAVEAAKKQRTETDGKRPANVVALAEVAA